MRRLLALALLLVLVGGGYYYYQSSQPASLSPSPPQLNLTQDLDLGSVTSVLGTTTSNLVSKTTEILNEATDGEAEPVINRTLHNLQEEVKDLPREQYEKVKYEFCRDIVEQYEEEQSSE
jgi:hypothetical protein